MRRLAIALLAVGGAVGCVPKETVREVQVPAKVPALCVSDCPVGGPAIAEGQKVTNGELAEAWRARGDAIECYKSRQACVREMIAPPSTAAPAVPPKPQQP